MWRLLGSALAIGLALARPGAAAAGEPVSIGILNVAPYGIGRPDGSVSGSNHDIAEIIAAKVGLTFNYRLEPLARLISDLKAGKLDLLIMLSTVELKSYAIADLMPNSSIVLPAPGLSFSAYEALKGRTIARLRGAIYDERMAGDDGIQKYDVDSYVLGLRMTKAGRVDGMVGPDFGLYYQVKSDGLKRDQFGPPLVLNTRMLVLHGSRTISSELAVRLKGAVDELRASGAIVAAAEPYVN
ncbi:MAG TPA: transporter substrate-binding domain-containing protein [Bradyrhizobium sp.]|nr:transporter substrate-binding domain-containing protein [Bradyrhizobium sp.]